MFGLFFRRKHFQAITFILRQMLSHYNAYFSLSLRNWIWIMQRIYCSTSRFGNSDYEKKKFDFWLMVPGIHLLGALSFHLKKEKQCKIKIWKLKNNFSRQDNNSCFFLKQEKKKTIEKRSNLDIQNLKNNQNRIFSYFYHSTPIFVQSLLSEVSSLAQSTNELNVSSISPQKKPQKRCPEAEKFKHFRKIS